MRGIIVPTSMIILSILSILSLITQGQAAVTISLGITMVNPKMASIKENLTDTWNLMYVGLYSAQDVKVQAMKFAIQYINNLPDILPNTRLELYGVNSKGNRGDTTMATLAGYAGYQVQGFIGAESFADTVAVQYIASAYGVPHINPTAVEQTLSTPKDYKSLFSVVPSSSDQQIAVLAIMKKLGIATALIIKTNNEYGSEFDDMMYNAETIKMNASFYQVTIDTNGSDHEQKLSIIKEQLPFYRYVIMHCSYATGLNFLQILGDNGLIGPDYLYIITHQMTLAIQERPSLGLYRPLFNGAIGISARFNSDTEFAQNIRNAFSQAPVSIYPSARADLRSAWFAFDAVYSYALALDSLLKQGYTTTTITGEKYYDELMNSNFIGATGNISVNVSAARRQGTWDVINFVADGVTSTSNGTVNAYYKAIANGYATELETVFGDFVFFNGRVDVPPPYVYVAPPEPILIRKYEWQLSAALGAVVGLATLVAVFAVVMLFMFWAAFAKHGSFYSAVILVGVFLSFISALIVLPEPTDNLCIAFPWFLGVGFTLVYGCLFIKTWTLYRVWLDAEKFKKTQLTPTTIIKAVGVAVFVEVIFLIIWTVIDPPQATLHEMVDKKYMLQCKTKDITFWAVFIAIKGGWLIFGSILSILTRRIMREFNHSASIAYAIYNIFALLVIGVPLAFTLEDIPGGQVIIQVAVIVIAFTFTTVCLFFNVWYRIFVPLETTISMSPARDRGTHSSTRSQNNSRATHSSSSYSHSHSQKSSSGSREEVTSRNDEDSASVV